MGNFLWEMGKFDFYFHNSQAVKVGCTPQDDDVKKWTLILYETSRIPSGKDGGCMILYSWLFMIVLPSPSMRFIGMSGNSTPKENGH